MIEVEIRAKIKNAEEAERKVLEFGARFVKKEHQVDCVFGHPSMLDENHLIVEGGYSARVRQVEGKIELTFKEIIRGKAGIEINAEIGNIETGKKFLARLGFEEAFEVDKIRNLYEIDGIEIAIDDVQKLGNFIEVEKIVDAQEKIDIAHGECQAFLDKLGIENEVITRKYGDLMQDLINKK